MAYIYFEVLLLQRPRSLKHTDCGTAGLQDGRRDRLLCAPFSSGLGDPQRLGAGPSDLLLCCTSRFTCRLFVQQFLDTCLAPDTEEPPPRRN